MHTQVDVPQRFQPPSTDDIPEFHPPAIAPTRQYRRASGLKATAQAMRLWPLDVHRSLLSATCQTRDLAAEAADGQVPSIQINVMAAMVSTRGS